MKHILEYEDHDIQDLLGDMEGIGQTKVYRGALWVSFNVLKSAGRLLHDVDFCYLMTEPIFGTGDESRDKGLALKKIQEGRWNVPDTQIYSLVKQFESGYAPIFKILSSESLTSLSKNFTDLAAFSLQVGKSLEEAHTYITNGEIFKGALSIPSKSARQVRTFGFVAPEGEDCLTSGYTGYHSKQLQEGIYYIK